MPPPAVFSPEISTNIKFYLYFSRAAAWGTSDKEDAVMGFFGKLFKGPEIDMEKSDANARKMR